MTIDKTTQIGGETWYSDASNYWNNVEASVNGMLGGLGHLDTADVVSSKDLLDDLVRDQLIQKNGYVCDCGAGIGRVSKHVLKHYFEKIDLVEAQEKFLNVAKQEQALKNIAQNFYAVGLESFQPEEGRYDVIWAQWVLSHLTDEHLVDFIKRCLAAVAPKNGVVVVKENIAQEDYVVDSEDSSVTRSETVWLDIFEKAGAQILIKRRQAQFPKNLFRVKMFVLKQK